MAATSSAYSDSVLLVLVPGARWTARRRRRAHCLKTVSSCALRSASWGWCVAAASASYCAVSSSSCVRHSSSRCCAGTCARRPRLLDGRCVAMLAVLQHAAGSATVRSSLPRAAQAESGTSNRGLRRAPPAAGALGAWHVPSSGCSSTDTRPSPGVCTCAGPAPPQARTTRSPRRAPTHGRRAPLAAGTHSPAAAA